ncbi:MAG: hypothetical protein GXY44_07265, partial [Phycisphaerales bacterium]|nr:hypothetical protein [Phycisphaerales bacterium]
MPTKTTNFWSRLFSRVKGRAARGPGRSDLPNIGNDGLLAEPAEMFEDNEAEASDRMAKPLSRWRRDQAIARLQEGYERVSHLIEDIQNHMSQQGERSDRMCAAIEQLNRSLADLPSVTRQQHQTLESIAGQLQANHARTQQLSESLADLPRLTKNQSETLAGIGRQLEMTGEQNVVTSQNMEKISQAITGLGETNERQSLVLHEMNAKTDEKTALLNDLIVRQN